MQNDRDGMTHRIFSQRRRVRRQVPPTIVFELLESRVLLSAGPVPGELPPLEALSTQSAVFAIAEATQATISIQLVNDTGASSTDRITSDLRMGGVLTGTGPFQAFRGWLDDQSAQHTTDLLGLLSPSGTFAIDLAQLERINGGLIEGGPHMLHLIAADGQGQATPQLDFSFGLDPVSGKSFNLLIDGDGWFTVKDENGATFHTREGRFEINKDGKLVTPNGDFLQGYQANAAGVLVGTLTDLTLPSEWTRDLVLPPPDSNWRPELELEPLANLDARAAAPAIPFDPSNAASYNFSQRLIFEHPIGEGHVVTLYFVKVRADVWDVYHQLDQGDTQLLTQVPFHPEGYVSFPSNWVTVTYPSLAPWRGTEPLSAIFYPYSLTQFVAPYGSQALDGPNSYPQIGLAANLDRTIPVGALPFDAQDPSTYHASVSTPLYDWIGRQETLRFYFVKSPVPGVWQFYHGLDGREASRGADLIFDEMGVIIEGGQQELGYFPYAWPTYVQNPRFLTVRLDLSGLMESDAPFALHSLASDSRGAGVLSSLSTMDEQGLIIGRYSNGHARVLWQLALAVFPHPEGLSPYLMGSAWETHASGQPTRTAPSREGPGLIVDLGERMPPPASMGQDLSLDVDHSGVADEVDGQLILRYLAGLADGQLTAGLITSAAPADVRFHLDGLRRARLSPLDADGNGVFEPFTDGRLLVRFLSGMDGDLLVAGSVLGEGATRTSAESVIEFLVPYHPGREVDPPVIEVAVQKTSYVLESITALPSLTGLIHDLTGVTSFLVGIDGMLEADFIDAVDRLRPDGRIVLDRALFESALGGTPLLDGPHVVRLKAIDGRGNSTVTPIEVSFTLDTSPPVVTIQLVNDTGVSPTDRITSDLRMIGVIQDASPILLFHGWLDDQYQFQHGYNNLLESLRPDGTFSFGHADLDRMNGAPLAGGSHVLHLLVVDDHGNSGLRPEHGVHGVQIEFSFMYDPAGSSAAQVALESSSPVVPGSFDTGGVQGFAQAVWVKSFVAGDSDSRDSDPNADLLLVLPESGAIVA